MRPASNATTAFLTLLLGISTACNAFAQKDATDQKAPTDKADDEITVKLLKAGDEPRQKLRFNFNAEGTQYLDIRMQMEMAMQIAGQQLPAQKMPAIIQTISIAPKSVEDGVMNYRYELVKMTIDKANANPVMVGAMEDAMKGIVGIAGSGQVDDRGFSEGNAMEFPEDANPQMVQQLKSLNETMSRLSSPLPEEPVGVGAEWEVALPIAMNGVNSKGINRYTVVAIDGNSVKTTVKTLIKAENQVIQNADLPPGTKLTIDIMEGKGEGNVEFDLSRLTPLSEIDMTMNQKSTITIPNADPQKMAMKMGLKMNIKPGVKPEGEF